MDDLVLRRRDVPIRAIGRLTLGVVVVLVLLGALLRVLSQIAPDRAVSWLVSFVGEPLRRRVLSPTTIARRIGVRSGMRVLLLDSGDGTTAEAIAREVGQTGHVESVSADRDTAQQARELLADAGVKNVNVVTARPQEVPFDDASFDAVCLLSTFGRSTTPRDIMAEVWRVLRPAGRLSASDIVSDPAFHLRRTVEKWGESVGFESLEHFGNTLAYTINFRKPLGVRMGG